MIQQRTKRIPLGRVVLILAALLVFGVVGYRFVENRGHGPSMISGAASGEAPTLADLEKATADGPDDAHTWRKLGLAYFEAQRFADAARAYERATALAPNDASSWSALGEARVMASEHDPMPSDAATAFDKALALDPKDPRARYFHAVRSDLAGNHETALSEWLSLLADTPPDAAWHDDLVRTIVQVGKINKIDVHDRITAAEKQAPAAKLPATSLPSVAQGIPGPTPQDLARASSMRPEDQSAMAEGMVERLEKRLKDDPRNVDGWIMLIRSRVTLQQPQKAANALADAVVANPGQADYLKQQAGILGVR